ncbi:MAG: ABC transporter ATP-binding protein [Desulfobulbaceae bacterium]|nr:ABC transporter ATP-binding protein [Desulfobulbaceae bacterium]
MSDVIIRAEDLCKVYRLYSKPQYRMLDMFGLLRTGQGRYTEHIAVDRFNLEIRRGEKVAFIGRNGAGKSTLLKLIARAIEPTSGRLDVNCRVHALLQIGTGFHPEFTGRENVYSYLSQLGVTGGKADRMVDEIVEFTELEEYIDQPIKTYSTGMGMRLMFATSTAIEPEILVLDEVLGVGDAYFAQKSYEKIKSLCEGQGSTLLLVTHDLYSAMEVCERFIWIERGALLMDADAGSVIHRYEASIRDQQEARLRRRHMKALSENNQTASKSVEDNHLFGQIRCEGNIPVERDVPIAFIRIFGPQGELCRLEPGVSTDGDTIRLYLQEGEHNWGEVLEDSGRICRSFSRHGSIYHRAPFVTGFHDLEKLLDGGLLEAEVEYRDSSSTPCLIELFHDNGLKRSWLRLGNDGSGEWRRVRGKLTSGTQLEVSQQNIRRYGTQRFFISEIEFLAADGTPSHIFDVGDSLKIRLVYEIRDPSFRQRPVIQLNFLKEGTTRSHRFALEGQLFDYSQNPRGTLEILAEPLLLGPGGYLVNVVVMSEGGYARGGEKAFFTANDNLLDHHSRAYELVVRPSDNILANDVVFYHRAKWKRDGRIIYDDIYPLNELRQRVTDD